MQELTGIVNSEPGYALYKEVYDKRSEIMTKLYKKGVIDPDELLLRTERIWNYLRRRKVINYLKQESNSASYVPNQTNP